MSVTVTITYVLDLFRIFFDTLSILKVLILIFVLVVVFHREQLNKNKSLFALWAFLASVLVCLVLIKIGGLYSVLPYGDLLLILLTFISSVSFIEKLKTNTYFKNLGCLKSKSLLSLNQVYVNVFKKCFNIKFICIIIGFIFICLLGFWYIGYFVNMHKDDDLTKCYGASLALSYFAILLNLLVLWVAKDYQNYKNIKETLSTFYTLYPQAKKDILINILCAYTVLMSCSRIVLLCAVVTNNVFLYCLIVYNLILLSYWVNLPAQREELLNKYNDQILQILSFNHWSTQKPIILGQKILELKINK